MRRIVIAVTLAALLVSSVFVLGQGSSVPPNVTPGLKITVSNQTCDMALAETAATPEATAETTPEAQPESTAVSTPSYPVLTLSSDCYTVTSLLFVPSNGILWVALALPNEPEWQHFAALASDPNPPQFDKRGRYVGCSIPQTGAQTCQFLWQNLDTTYLIQLPVTVHNAYVAPVTNTPVPTTGAPISTPLPTNDSGIWGSCGSCTTCGGPVEQCVTSPQGECLWDAATCEHPKHNG